MQRFWQHFQTEGANLRKDGSLFFVDQSIATIEDETKKVTHYVSFSKDATQRLQYELALKDMASKDALTGMGRLVIPWGGWSSLRKAELIAEIAGVLSSTEWLPTVLEGLEQEDRAALDELVDQGGKMPWQAFDARYGNDLDESFHWKYHEPESVMGRLRMRGLLAEAIVSEDLWVAVTVEVREALAR